MTDPHDAGPGLSTQEVAERVRAGQTNRTTRSTSRSLTAILRSNVFTLFNLILAVAVTLVLLTGRWPDAVFGFVVVINAAIGIVTEYRAKRTLDRLSILTAPSARVVRDGAEQEVALDDVVQDDVLLVGTGTRSRPTRWSSRSRGSRSTSRCSRGVAPRPQGRGRRGALRLDGRRGGFGVPCGARG